MSDSITRRTFLGSSITAGLAVGMTSVFTGDAQAAGSFAENRAVGYVFHDEHGEGVRRAESKGIAGVRISNGVDIVQTDANGRYVIPVHSGQILFVIKPSGWRVPVNENKLPQFYYIHKPQGSPKWRPTTPLSQDERNPKYYYPGSAPTGSLPQSIDFPLLPQPEPTKFRCLVQSDPQISGLYQLHWLNQQSMREIIKLKDIPFGMILGDIVNVGRLNLYGPLNQAIGKCDFPWYMTLGNHDQNLMTPDNTQANETFQAQYGPDHYAFDYAHVSFLVINNVFRNPYESKARYNGKGKFSPHKNNYTKGMSDEQWAFIENYLKTVPLERPLVIAMHIPLSNKSGNAFDKRFLKLISNRPHTLSMSGHTHRNDNFLLGREHGFKGPGKHHHLNTAVTRGCGYRGPFDELHIPANVCMDGCPCGYSILNFDGNRYTVDYKASRRDEDLQMHLYLKDEVMMADLEKTELLANVFTTSDRSVVKMQVDNYPWQKMQRFDHRDPALSRILQVQNEDGPGRWVQRIPRAKKAWVSHNFWKANLPTRMDEGIHLAVVKHTDMYGRVFEERRWFMVKTSEA